MSDFASCHMIEAMRSGVPSFAVGKYFSDSRPEMMQKIIHDLDGVEEGTSTARMFSAPYGEGKTHLLHTVFCLAKARNMVVSILPLSKEAPFDRLYLLYQKLVANTYLPSSMKPGFMQELEKVTPGSEKAKDLLLFADRELQTDKLYYVLRSYFSSKNQDDTYQLQSDLEGDFITNDMVRQIYKKNFHETVKFRENFNRAYHSFDYFAFLSHLFKLLGYAGWVILFDETELVGRLSRKTRMKVYRNMYKFFHPTQNFENGYTLFALSSSFVEDVLNRRDEAASVDKYATGKDAEDIQSTLACIQKADTLAPLNKDEIISAFQRIITLHGKAYDWNPPVDAETLYKAVSAAGFLLRTKIRAAIEYLDQVFQYGDPGESKTKTLQLESLAEESSVDLSDVLGKKE